MLHAARGGLARLRRRRCRHAQRHRERESRHQPACECHRGGVLQLRRAAQRPNNWRSWFDTHACCDGSLPGISFSPLWNCAQRSCSSCDSLQLCMMWLSARGRPGPRSDREGCPAAQVAEFGSVSYYPGDPRSCIWRELAPVRRDTTMTDGARVAQKSQSILSHSQCLRRQEPSELAEPLSVRRAVRP
jgi:hypothetical protein